MTTTRWTDKDEATLAGSAGAEVIPCTQGDVDKRISPEWLRLWLVDQGMGAPGSDASVTNGNVNTAIATDPGASRTALGLGSAALAAAGDFASAAQGAKADSAVQPAAMATALDDKADLVGGVVPSSQIPAIAITQFLGEVASEAAMLALPGEMGDWCIRTDDPVATWIITGSDPTSLGSWTKVSVPVAPVSTVNGQAGTVVLGKGDVGLGSADNTADTDKPISTLQQAALDGKAAAADGASARNTATVVTSSAGVANVNLALGDYFTLALTENITSLTFSNLPGAGKGCTIMLQITQHASSAKTFAWPASFKWTGGTAGAVSTAVSKVDVLALTTFDNGTTWRVTLAKGFG